MFVDLYVEFAHARSAELSQLQTLGQGLPLSLSDVLSGLVGTGGGGLFVSLGDNLVGVLVFLEVLHGLLGVELVLHLAQVVLFLYQLLVQSLLGEGVYCGIWLVDHQPVVLGFDLLSAALTMSRHPVLSNGVEDHSASLLLGRKPSFTSELLPLGLWLLLGHRLLSRSDDVGSGHLNAVQRLGIFKDFPILSFQGLLLSFKIEELLENGAHVGLSHFEDLLRRLVLVALAVLNEEGAQVAGLIGGEGMDAVCFGCCCHSNSK